MKYAQINAFRKHLEGAAPSHFSPIYGILAKDDFLRQEAIDELFAAIRTHAPLSKKKFSGEKFQAGAFFEELEGWGLFAERRCIILQQCDKLPKPAIERLEKYFLSPNASVFLVLSAPTLNRNTNYYKKAEKAGVFLDIPEEKPWEKEKNAKEWALNKFRKEGKAIEAKALDALVKAVGADYARLHGEIQKLVCYSGEASEIKGQDVCLLTAVVNSETVWQLGEFLFMRNIPQALRIGKGLLDEGTALIALLRQLRTQFQTEYQVCSILAHGGGSQAISAQFPYMQGFILERHIKQAQSFGLTHFRSAILAIDQAELDAKNTGLESDLIFERLVFYICNGVLA